MNTPVQVESWGRAQTSTSLLFGPVIPESEAGVPWLPHGFGRSYGDAALNSGGILLETGSLNRILAFDAESGILRAEAGISLAAILEQVVPQGWFLPVTPGTKWVSLGGAVASDVHGKNHHRAGTFGRHVRRFELRRSDGFCGVCSPEEHPDYYQATIGGMGLTGLMIWVEIQLEKIPSAWFQVRNYPFSSLASYLTTAREADETHAHTVAWMDWLRFQRQGDFTGAISAGQAVPHDGADAWKIHPSPRITIPRHWPLRVTWPLSQQIFNRAYATRLLRQTQSIVHYDSFFYPLDVLHFWNRLYGRQGFFQHQSLVPHESVTGFYRELRELLNHHRHPVYLAVIKTFGSLTSPGLLSFPRPGITSALDIPNLGLRSQACLQAMNALTLQHGGRCYAAKDCTLTPEEFRRTQPNLERFNRLRDPGIASDWSRRVLPHSRS
jgi:FAD/FMN-containing dehydrogenase